MDTILVVDDHPAVVRGLSAILEKENFNVMEARSFSEAVLMARYGKNFSVVIADLTLASPTSGDTSLNSDGLEMIGEMRKCGFEGKTLVYTMHDEPWNVRRLKEAGVDAVVFKGERPAVLIDAVKALVAGEEFKGGLFESYCDQFSSDILSDKEQSILNQVAEGKQNDEIADRLALSEKTVEYHRSNILKKLSARNMTQAIGKAMSMGLLKVMALAFLPFAVANADVPQPKEVDLGLSVLWADCNLGASTPYESGGYYSFGELSEKEDYTWETYKHCDGNILYCHDIGESISGTEYDVAHVLLGNGWRMPTMNEISELIDGCSYESFFIDEKAYGRLTTSSGEELILPICGYMSQQRLVYENVNGVYLSGDCEYDEEYDESEGKLMRIQTPLALNMNKTAILEGYSNASLGSSIRPVKDRTSSVDMIQENLLNGNESKDSSAKPEIYTLQGVKVGDSLERLPSGIYLLKKGTKVTKVLLP